MSVVINTNVDSLKIQSNVNVATKKLSQAMERMSTGLKVISAKDDAAGTVISAKMNVQLNGNKICQNNIQNANALLSSTEGNLQTIEDNLTRIRDLTLQAKNGTYSAEEVQAMQDEVKERIQEINRVSHSASYGSLKLFGDTAVEIGKMTPEELFKIDASTEGVTGAPVAITGNIDKYITDYATTDGKISFKFAGTAIEPYQASVEVEKEGTKPTGTKETASIVNQVTNENGTVTYLRKKETVTYADGSATGKYKETTATAYDLVTVDLGRLAKDGANFQVGANAGEDNIITADKSLFASVEFGILTGIDEYDLTKLASNEDFDTVLVKMDKGIDNITSRKSIIGSAGNRLDSALDTLNIQYENLSSAKSIILDADIAQEASNFTQQQILQQVSVSLLAQANQAPSIALSLV